MRSVSVSFSLPVAALFAGRPPGVARGHAALPRRPAVGELQRRTHHGRYVAAWSFPESVALLEIFPDSS